MIGVPPEPTGILVTFWMGIEEGYWAFDNANWKYGKNIYCPVLIERGTIDRRVTEKESQKVLASLSSKDKKILHYEGLGHESYYEKVPQEWTKNVVGFLNAPVKQ